VLTPTLLALGHEVTVVDNFLFRQNSLADAATTGVPGGARDCRDEALMKKLVAGAEAIIPLAALVGAAVVRPRPGGRPGRPISRPWRCSAAWPPRPRRILVPVTNSGYGVGEKASIAPRKRRSGRSHSMASPKWQAEEAILQRENSISFRLATVLRRLAPDAHGPAGQ